MQYAVQTQVTHANINVNYILCRYILSEKQAVFKFIRMTRHHTTGSADLYHIMHCLSLAQHYNTTLL